MWYQTYTVLKLLYNHTLKPKKPAAHKFKKSLSRPKIVMKTNPMLCTLPGGFYQFYTYKQGTMHGLQLTFGCISSVVTKARKLDKTDSFAR